MKPCAIRRLGSQLIRMYVIIRVKKKLTHSNNVGFAFPPLNSSPVTLTVPPAALEKA
ncbi:hypothetical protein D3C84_1312380 [compost metagenome]